MPLSQTNSLISLGRALFGDFDIDTIIENSPNYMNTAFYLAYLFVAVFILLSMFLAILGEAQANLRDDQRDERQRAHDLGEEIAPEYGIITEGAQVCSRHQHACHAVVSVQCRRHTCMDDPTCPLMASTYCVYLPPRASFTDY